MAFVNENGVKEYDEHLKIERTYNRTIDHDRNIVLRYGKSIHRVQPPPNPEDPIKDNFILKGEDFQVRIEAHQRYKEIKHNEFDLYWNVYRVWDVEGIEGREQEIVNIIVEAINAYGVRFGKKNINSITVEFGDEYTKNLTLGRHIEPIITLENN